MGGIVDYFTQNWEDYLQLVLEHLQISLTAISIAIVIAVPAGVLSSQYPLVRKIVTAITSGLRIIPSLAILFISIPYIGVGKTPAVIALILLAMPPILLNTIVGFTTVDADIIEAAIGMGMDNRRLFYKIKVPLAFPKVFAGIRTASVEVISNATLAAYIGAGGLGNLIFTGLNLMRFDILLVGGVSVALLSLILGQMMNAWDRRIRMYE